eukprot:7381664-Prymnesium_polylepis.1
MAAAARGRPSGTEAWRIASSARRSAKSGGGAGVCVTWPVRVSAASCRQLWTAQGAACEVAAKGMGQRWP